MAKIWKDNGMKVKYDIILKVKSEEKKLLGPINVSLVS